MQKAISYLNESISKAAGDLMDFYGLGSNRKVLPAKLLPQCVYRYYLESGFFRICPLDSFYYKASDDMKSLEICITNYYYFRLGAPPGMTTLNSLVVNGVDLFSQQKRAALEILDIVLSHYELPKLESLSITGWQPKIKLGLIGGLEMLKKLSMTSCKADNYTFIEQLNGLESLEMLGHGLSEDDLELVGRLTNLKTLIIDGVSETSSKFIKRLSNLTTLSVNSSNIGDGIQSIAKLTKLRSLSIRKNNLRDENVWWISKLQNLTHLDIGENPLVTNVGFSYLEDIKGLKHSTHE
jgi:Leucine-rich repeat (LRR) protein